MRTLQDEDRRGGILRSGRLISHREFMQEAAKMRRAGVGPAFLDNVRGCWPRGTAFAFGILNGTGSRCCRVSRSESKRRQDTLVSFSLSSRWLQGSEIRGSHGMRKSGGRVGVR